MWYDVLQSHWQENTHTNKNLNKNKHRVNTICPSTIVKAVTKNKAVLGSQATIHTYNLTPYGIKRKQSKACVAAKFIAKESHIG